MGFFSSPILLVPFRCRHNICGDSCEKQHQKQHMTLRNTLFDPGAQTCEQALLALSKWLYVNSLRAYGFAIGSHVATVHHDFPRPVTEAFVHRWEQHFPG
jgi:hypothetical protein